MTLKDGVRTWETMVKHDKAGTDWAVKRMDLIRQIRSKLKEYREFPRVTCSC